MISNAIDSVPDQEPTAPDVGQRSALRHTLNAAVSAEDDAIPVLDLLNDSEGLLSVDSQLVLNKYFVGHENAQQRLWWKLWISWVLRLPLRFQRIAIKRMRLHIWYMICKWLGSKQTPPLDAIAHDADGLWGACGVLEYLEWHDAQGRKDQQSATIQRLITSGSLRGGVKGRGKGAGSTRSQISQDARQMQGFLEPGNVLERNEILPNGALSAWQQPQCVVGQPQIATGRETTTADGNCLYYCLCACVDVAAWRLLTPQLKLEQGKALRQRFISYMRYVEENELEADRLQLEGSSGYPGTDLLPSLSRFLGCTIQCVWEGRNPDGEI